MRPLTLIILDGWGHRDHVQANAVAQAKKPVFDRLWETCPRTLLHASSTPVGLPKDQIGSSEVGHTIIGAGSNVTQLFAVITDSILDGSFFTNKELLTACAAVKASGGRLHIAGLTSDGGVHSHWEHLRALFTLAAKAGLAPKQVLIHVILDGRDVGPKTAKSYVERLNQDIASVGVGAIASIQGRYWIMDRDKRWDRVKRGYEAVVDAKGHAAASATQVVERQYAQGVTDEFIEPTIIGAANPMQDGDALVFFNFRADRARQFMRALTQPGFKEFERGTVKKIHAVCMAQYDATLKLPFAFQIPDDTPSHPGYLNLPAYIDSLGIRQLRIAETEKYAHVTYFFSGGRETAYPLEERMLVPSPQVATYDLTPEMSAEAVTAGLLEKMGGYGFIVCNYANADMVGHSGDLTAAQKACEAIDRCLGKALSAADRLGHTVIITADHGNCEFMSNPDGSPHTAHTTNRVPFIVYNSPLKNLRLKEPDGHGLRDIAATIVELMGLPKATWFEGSSLIANAKS
ncbi:MAG: 2,3-bisphosphoglycerate-independent phosphoglycerate mutase [Elusimicrobiota bacterium]